MSDYLYRCAVCGDVRKVCNLDDHPPKSLECYCAVCAERECKPTRHIRIPETRYRMKFGDTELTVYHTQSEDATLVIDTLSVDGGITLILNQESAIRLAAFIDYEMFGQEGFE